jgi:uncharacterized protein YndB with AHSA1/START domain
VFPNCAGDPHSHLAERAGIDAAQLDRPPTAVERKANLLHDAFVFSRRELASERGADARGYLERRGVPPDRLGDVVLGVMPDVGRLRLALAGAGHRDDEIAASGILADSRWPGRIVGAWSDERCRVVTLWARAIDDDAEERYLYLRGAPRVGALPYGMSDLLTSASKADRAELTLVEGVMDVPVLRATGIRSVAALGGASVGGGLFERLADHGDHQTRARQQVVRPFTFKVTECSIDLRVGGDYHIVFVTEQGADCSFRGTYVKVEPSTRTVATWLFEGWPDAHAVETTELHEADGVTTMTVSLMFRDQAGRDNMTRHDGQEDSLDKLEEHLASLLVQLKAVSGST